MTTRDQGQPLPTSVTDRLFDMPETSSMPDRSLVPSRARNAVGCNYSPAPVDGASVERILSRVRKPGRYAGGEWNSVQKDWAATPLKWCFAYPDLYEIRMSNLGLRILYEILNDQPDRLAERCFAGDIDLRSEEHTA